MEYVCTKVCAMSSSKNAEIKGSRNPFGVQDAPDPDGRDVAEFAASANLSGAASDVNAEKWAAAPGSANSELLEGQWFSRWNGGADPTIAGDAKEHWKQGTADVRVIEDRIYFLFNWSSGARRALLDARRQGPRNLTGRYINLSDPSITRPWAGLIVDTTRIDGRWTNGRLDFRR